MQKQLTTATDDNDNKRKYKHTCFLHANRPLPQRESLQTCSPPPPRAWALVSVPAFAFRAVAGAPNSPADPSLPSFALAVPRAHTWPAPAARVCVCVRPNGGMDGAAGGSGPGQGSEAVTRASKCFKCPGDPGAGRTYRPASAARALAPAGSPRRPQTARAGRPLRPAAGSPGRPLQRVGAGPNDSLCGRAGSARLGSGRGRAQAACAGAGSS